MDNAFGDPQTIVLLGGTSEIGQAIVRRCATAATRTVVLAARRPSDTATFASELRARGIEVDAVPFDATTPSEHGPLVRSLVERHGDLDLVDPGLRGAGGAGHLRSGPDGGGRCCRRQLRRCRLVGPCRR